MAFLAASSITFYWNKDNSWKNAEEIITVTGNISKETWDALKSSPFVHGHTSVDEEGREWNVLLKEKTLSILPLIICPPLLDHLKFSTVESCQTYMIGVLVQLFPQAAYHVPGLKASLPSRPEVRRDLYYHRIVESWMSMKSMAQMTHYLWRKWMECIGLARLGPMLRNAPSGNNVVGSLVSEYSQNARSKRRG